MMQQILDKIKEYNRIIIHRHIRPDGDCIGAQFGLKEIIRASFPEKEVYAIGDDIPEYLAYVGSFDNAANDLYEGALVIVVDTSTSARIYDERYKNGAFLIKIDHHDDAEDFGDIIWVDEKSPATSAMIAQFYEQFKNELKLNHQAANALFTGIVTDTGRFKYSNVNGELLKNAGDLLDQGLELDSLYANLYVKEASLYKLQGYTYTHFKSTENGVVYIHFTKRIMKKYDITPSDAGNLVNTLDSINGSLIWMALIDQPDGTIRVRLRSRFVAINDICTNYRGGGHLMASGATLLSKKEIPSLLKDLDQRLKEFKAVNEGVK
jgi:phosphoesterase RecJ-like protein